MAKPVWLLDVDGVINAVRPGWHAAPRTRTVMAGDGQWYRIRWAPALVGRILRLITAGVEVRWCSTWCGDTAMLEHALGLPTLPSAFEVPEGRFVGELKANAARSVLDAGRRLVWTDDMEVPDSGPLFDELTAAGLALLLRPDERRGLLPEDMDRIEGWCGQPAIVGT